jgi:hypothetical protein
MQPRWLLRHCGKRFRVEPPHESRALLLRDLKSRVVSARVETNLLTPQQRVFDRYGVSGTAEELAGMLHTGADMGVDALMVLLTPQSVESIERFGRVLQMFSA